MRESECARLLSLKSRKKEPTWPTPSLSDWPRFMQLEPAGYNAELDRYIGYWEPYATSHEVFDRDVAMQGEVRQAAQTLAEALKAKRAGKWTGAEAAAAEMAISRGWSAPC